MEPCLPEGAWIGVRWFGEDRPEPEPEVGEIVLCRSKEGHWLVHRIVRKEQSRWLVKGDAAFVTDSFSKQEMWGRAVLVRGTDSGPSRPVRTGLLDRVIAHLSYLSLRRPGLAGRIFRRAALAFGRLRRFR